MTYIMTVITACFNDEDFAVKTFSIGTKYKGLTIKRTSTANVCDRLIYMRRSFLILNYFYISAYSNS